MPIASPRLLALLCIPAFAPAQENWLWRPVSGPVPRSHHAMVFDSLRAVTVLFGGRAGPATFHDTWEWDGTAWTQRFPATVPTSGGEMAFDSWRGVAVLVTPTGTWEWNGVDWSLRTSSYVPCLQIAFDSSRGRTVVLSQIGASQPTSTLVNEWDGVAWTPITTATGPFHSVMTMAYDPVAQRTVAYTPFQGVSNPTAGARLWSWDGVAWTSTPPTGSPYNQGAKFVFFPPMLWLCGGGDSNLWYLGLYQPFVFSNSTTMANAGGRLGHGVVYDSVRQRVVLFGGYRHNTLRGDTWELVRGSMTAATVAYGQSCGTPPLTFAAAAGSRPLLGSTFVADIGNAAPGGTGVMYGSSGQENLYGGALPIDLGSSGMPGCTLWTNMAGTIWGVTSGANSQFVLAVPPSIALCGLQLYVQAFSYRAAANARELITSNALQFTLGNV